MNNSQETAKYAIQVTNELFHGINVEAWQNVIESYETNHNGLKVNLFFEDEPVHNIHELNAWGKIRCGSTIRFSVSGEEFKGIAKLKDFLSAGAGRRAAHFKKNDMSRALNLDWKRR